MTTQRYGVWSVRWSNPNKPRPEGFPAILLQLRTPLAPGQGAGQCPSEVAECWEEMRPYGYAVSWHDERPARTLPIETKQRIRRRNLWKRLLKRYPMFVETFYAEAVTAKPDNYGPYLAGEFADMAFVQTIRGYMKLQPSRKAH